MKKLTKMENKLEKLVTEMELLVEIYENKKGYQQRLTNLSVELSDVYAMIKDLPAINVEQRQSWQKERKLQFKLFNIDTTVKMLTTEHLTSLSEDELKIVLNRINELYDEMNQLKKGTDEYKELNHEYLDLKTKLNEPVSFEYKNPVMNKPRQLTIDEYNFKSVSNVIKNIYYFEVNDVETFNDVKQALNVVKFTHNQIIAINQALADGRVDKDRSKDYELATKKIVKALNEQNVYKMKIENHFF